MDQTCPHCHKHIQAIVFRAFGGSGAGATAQQILTGAEASCFYHPGNQAATPCDECGRFLCHLCDLSVDGRHLCPNCFQSGVKQRRISAFDGQRTLHDTIALALATLPPFMIWPVVFSAPLTLYWVIRYWKAPPSLVPRTRIRFYLAALFALTQIGFMVAVILSMIYLPRGRR